MMIHRALRVAAIAVLACVAVSCLDSSVLTDAPTTPGGSPVKWVLVQPAAATIAPGKQLALDVALQDAAGRAVTGVSVTWKSSNAAVASVNDSGVVTAHKAGAVHISAISGNTSAYANVTVSTAPPPQLTVRLTPSLDTVAVQGILQLFASVYDAKGTLDANAVVSYRSNDMSVAAVDSSGVVTGMSTGKATITATAGTGSATMQVVVVSAADTTSTPTSPPPTSPPPSGALYSGYNQQSPHWQHITTMMTDFYYKWTSSERLWAGEHYDYAMSGDGSAWQAANPTVTHLPYALEWATIVPSSTTPVGITTGYYGDMQQWYAQHPSYSIESAFLHTAGAPLADSAHRLVIYTWGTHKWLLNPADPGLRAYQADRLSRVAAGHGGVFLDAEGSGDMLRWVSQSMEYPSTTNYESAHTSLLAAVRQALNGKMLMINTAQYTKSFDLANAIAAGAVHLEKMNNPLNSDMYLHWQWCETLLNDGVFVDFVSTYSTSEEQKMSGSIPPGNSATTVQRLKLWELASYYMVVPASPAHFALQLENLWNLPYSSIWTRAQEANIGHPTAPRKILSRGTDPLGQGYTVYSRDFDRALVLVRHQSGWGTQSYVDASAITVRLPAGQTWLPLHADGTLGAAVTSIKLRNAEAAILIKKSTIQ